VPAPGNPDNIRRRMASGADMTEVRDNTAKNQFELIVDGHTALAAYRLKPGVIKFTHTEVPKELGGRGIGSQLAKGALDQVRERRLQVVPLCPFIKAYIEKHPEYADMVSK
jgi:predicted GNAT family acetyltransferase